MLKAELTRLANGLVVGGEEKRETKEIIANSCESSLSYQQLLEAYGLALHLERDIETPILFLQRELHLKERSVVYVLLSSVLGC